MAGAPGIVAMTKHSIDRKGTRISIRHGVEFVGPNAPARNPGLQQQRHDQTDAHQLQRLNIPPGASREH